MNQLALRDAIFTPRARVAPGPAAAAPTTLPASRPGRMSGWLVWCLVVAPAAAMLWATTGAARDCHLKPIALVLGLDTQITATVPSGVSCSVRTLTGDATIADLTIDSPPRYGELAPRDRTGVFYRSDPKFKGEDSFIFALRGGSSSAHAKSVVRVHVTVK
jgi:hypothetical protein